MDNNLLENLFLYKKSTALFAAYQLGLFAAIKEKGCVNTDIFNEYGWNIKYTELLCLFLEDEGFITKKDEYWIFSKGFEKQFDSFNAICEYENNLYHKWLAPEQIVSAVRSNSGERPFDKIGFNEAEQKNYNSIVYGENINIIAFQILRRLKRKKDIRCLEYGKSNGKMGNVLKKYIPGIQIDVSSLKEDVIAGIEYDVILIINTIHYKTQEEWHELFTTFRSLLGETGLVIIADMFYETGSVFQATVLMDWITHGGINNICKGEINTALEESGYKNIEHQYIQSISSDLFFVCK